MATAVHPAMTMPPSFSSNQCMDPDAEFFDFSQLPSPTPATISRQPSNAASSITSPTTTVLDGDDLQTPAKPSHEYGRFKQQTGLPSGSIAGINPSFNSGYSMYSSTGLDEMSLMGESSMMPGWNSGIGMDVDMGMSSSSFFFPTNDASQSDDFVDPSAIVQEEVQNVRVWPGMHQQQAALAKAQAQAQQQRQQQQRQQASLQQQKRPHNRNSSASPLSDAQTEETIARVVNQIRQQSQSSALAAADQGNLLPHIIRAKKDEDEMDEDEKLLASEEGKKLSSKERRQLRNKVSARAFRSRRKEYIGQLEGEVALKTNEANELRTQNRALMEENARSRAFIERLLRHQAFTPFLEELSREEGIDVKPVMSSLSSASTTPTPATARKDVNPYQNQQFGGMPSQPNNPQIGMTLIPETPLDMSLLNLSSNSWNTNSNVGSFNYQPRVFAVTELPAGPVNPIDTDALSGKGFGSIFAAEDDSPVEPAKPDFPVIERPMETKPVQVEIEEEDEDPEFDLYRSSSSTSASVAAAPYEQHESLFGAANPEKVFAHFELFISEESADERLMARFERQCAKMDRLCERIDALTSFLDS